MTSEEAEARMEDIYDALKLELSPNYVLEVPDVPGMTVDGLKQAYLTRNKLARIQRGLPCDESEAELWTELEAAVAR